jgi:hypothetical protein
VLETDEAGLINSDADDSISSFDNSNQILEEDDSFNSNQFSALRKVKKVKNGDIVLSKNVTPNDELPQENDVQTSTLSLNPILRPFKPDHGKNVKIISSSSESEGDILLIGLAQDEVYYSKFSNHL